MNKKRIAFFLVLFIILLGSSLYFWQTKHEQSLTVALIPLDSRPCNTQYPKLLGESAGMKILLPPTELLDNYLMSSDKDGLWRWLEKNASHCDHILISTNQLFQGSLINSRNSDSLAEMSDDLMHLKSFCETHPDVEITVLSILPRLLPSQYDSVLAPYTNELQAYGSAWDQAVLTGSPLPTCNVPQEALSKYRNLFLETEQMLTVLESLAASGSCTLIIGQDDASEYCPSNIIKRNIQVRNTPNVSFIHGADELEMLILASYLDLPQSEIKIIIDDETALETYFPYEAADLETILNEKLAFANIAINDQAADTIFIHTKMGDTSAVKEYLASPHTGYSAIADIAYTNRGDKSLAPLLLASENFSQINCYSGWNTCGNTLGTVLAHYRFSQAYQDNKKSARALLEFKAVRFSEDLIYQALVSPELKSTLVQKGLMDPSTTAFKADKAEIAPYLTAACDPYASQLGELFQGTQEILPGHFAEISDITFTFTFPWDRAFEIKAESTIKLK